MPPVPGDPIEFWAAFSAIATALAAVATVAAFGLAFYQIITELRARREDERMRQARRISSWVGGMLRADRHDDAQSFAEGAEPTAATLLNASDEPVYRLVAWLVLVQGAGPRTGEEAVQSDMRPAALSILPPGRYVIALPGGWGGMSARAGIEIAFTDAAGRHWIRRALGQLQAVPADAVAHYGLEQPVNWGYLVGPEGVDAP